jgi:type II secretory pathway component GspD/PulD (secretin)
MRRLSKRRHGYRIIVFMVAVMVKKFIIFLIGFGAIAAAQAHEPKFSERTDILHIIESYSNRTGTKFVTDPRVKARVNMIGLDIEEVTQTNLMDIFLIHNFTAYKSEGVVYVVPVSAVDLQDFEAGAIWDSE